VKKRLTRISLIFFLVAAFPPGALAGGMFGPPQTLSAAAGGLNTAIGYLYHEDTYKNHPRHKMRHNIIYSQAAWGKSGMWEIYGRLAAADMKMSDAFRSCLPAAMNIGSEFHDYWKFFGTLGAKGFYPVNRFFGGGIFMQASYNPGKYTDETPVLYNGSFFVADLEIKNLWDINLGAGLQATLPGGIRAYAGPFVYLARADARMSHNIPGLPFGTEKTFLKNKSPGGGYFGADIPLIRGFRLNIEGQYTSRFSAGAAISYVY
jgi:hypothetical protein